MPVVVSGIGAHCALGENTKALWEAIQNGQSGIAPIDRFDVTPFDTGLGAIVGSGDDYVNDTERLIGYGCTAAEEALSHADIKDRGDVAMVLGTCNGIVGEDVQQVGNLIAKRLGLGGFVITISTACASSAHAIGLAGDLLRMGLVKYVLAGGVDLLTKDIFAGFNALRILSKKPCAPFSITMGTTLGEGSGFVLLEEQRTALCRKINPLAAFLGYGLSADAYHDTKPDPSGQGLAKACRLALKEAGLDPTLIDYFNAHGTGTAANDASEWNAIRSVFHNHAKKLPVSSSKSFLGHTQGAAGVLEVISTLMAMNNNVILPTLNLDKRRPNVPTDPVAEEVPRYHPVEKVLCANAAFGGVNTALIFGKVIEIESTPLPRSNVRTIAIGGIHETTDSAKLGQFIPRTELRGLDLSARLLGGAVANVLANANIRIRSKQTEEMGFFVGQNHISPESITSFRESVKEHGWRNLSASAFTRMVVNYATGACCRLIGLKGPALTLSSSPDSGLVALIASLCFLSNHEQQSTFVSAAVDEPKEGDNYDCRAIAALLHTTITDSSIVLSGWAITEHFETAIHEALRKAKMSITEVRSFVPSYSSATAGLSSVKAAFEELNGGAEGPILIYNKDAGSTGAAVILEKMKEKKI